MKIALVSPKGPLYRHRGGIFRRSLRYAPLTLTTLASLVPDDLHPEFTLVDEGIDDVDLDLEADVIGMTVITGTAPRAYELAAHFRSRGIPVILGGPHVTLVPDDAQPHADSRRRRLRGRHLAGAAAGSRGGTSPAALRAGARAVAGRPAVSPA